MRTQWLTAATFVALSIPALARADFVSPPWTRGGAGTTYQEWNTFTAPTGANAPDVAENNPNGNASLQNSEASAFVTGGGNIYSFAEPLVIDVTVPTEGLGAGYLTSLILQVRTQGNELDPTTVKLTPLVGSPLGFASSQELSRIPLASSPTFGGAIVDTLYRWDVSGNATSYLLEFSAAESSLSLDRVSVDTLTSLNAVPEPASLVP